MFSVPAEGQTCLALLPGFESCERRESIVIRRFTAPDVLTGALRGCDSTSCVPSQDLPSASPRRCQIEGRGSVRVPKLNLL